MTQNQMLETQIKELIHECSCVPIENIELDHHLFTDLGMDSVSSMELIGLLDETFELEIELEDSIFPGGRDYSFP